MSLKDQFANDLKDAIRQSDENRKTALRMLITAIKNAEVAAIRQLNDQEVLVVVARQAKQRHESIEEFQKAGRQDLVDKEAAELKILEAYLPPAISRDEIATEARKVIQEVGAGGPGDKGKVMQALMPRLAGRAEGRTISEVVTELLAAAPS
ncbi:MAG: GatB/YqeY domain-containing protein [Dehalococcoidia bacterium]|nr:GatB/YqeY domain-containing protein [Dehalococcoidia bacterium]